MNHEQEVFSFVGVKDRLKMFEQKSQEKTSPKLTRRSVCRPQETSPALSKTNPNSEIITSTFPKTTQNQNMEVKFRITNILKTQKPTEQSNSNNLKEPPLVLAPPPKLCDVQNSHKLGLQSKLGPTLSTNLPENPMAFGDVQAVKYQTIQKVLGKIEAVADEKLSQSQIRVNNELQEKPSTIKTINSEGRTDKISSISETNSDIQVNFTPSKINLLSNDKIVHPLPPPPPPVRIHDITSISALPPIPPPLPVLNSSQRKYPEMLACNKIPHTDDIQPPVPPPLPVLNTSQRKQPEMLACNNTQQTDDTEPPVPPPLPSLTKTTKKTNVLVGWAKSTPDEPQVNKDNDREQSNQKDININVTEPEKAPPVVAAPPSLECIMGAKKAPPVVVAPPSLESVMKISDRDLSSRLVHSIRDSGSSSIHSGDNEEDTYDNEEEALNAEPWYFNVTKEEASAIIKDATKKGSYMMRPSENKQYVLMVRTENTEIKKFKIQRYENGWILGDPSNSKKKHSSISALMDYYKTNGIKFGNSNIVLKTVVPKK